jgi:hypothetical protein
LTPQEKEKEGEEEKEGEVGRREKKVYFRVLIFAVLEIQQASTLPLSYIHRPWILFAFFVFLFFDFYLNLFYA